MKPLLLTLALLAGLGAFAIGWATARPPAGLLAVRQVATERPMTMLPNPNEAAVAALDSLAEALGPTPPPPRTQGEPIRPAPVRPPEPDVTSIFRRQLTAVVAEGQAGRLAALLSDEGPARMLRPGEMFMAGWRLSSLTMGEAVLGRGRERKVIPLFDPNAAGGYAPSAEPAANSTEPDASGAPLAHNDGVGLGEALA